MRLLKLEAGLVLGARKGEYWIARAVGRARRAKILKISIDDAVVVTTVCLSKWLSLVGSSMRLALSLPGPFTLGLTD